MEFALQEALHAGPLEIRPEESLAVLDGRVLHLTRHELGLLIALGHHPGTILGRQQLALQAWGRPLRPGDRSVDVYVRRLRSKLADAAPDWIFIHTHFAYGYRFDATRSQVFHSSATGS